MKRVHVQLTDWQLERLKLLSDYTGQSVSSIVRDLVSRYLENLDSEQIEKSLNVRRSALDFLKRGGF